MTFLLVDSFAITKVAPMLIEVEGDLVFIVTRLISAFLFKKH